MIRCRTGRIGNASCFGLRCLPLRCVNISLPLRTCCFPNRITSARLCPVNNSLEVARILSNVTQILEDRIVTKAKKCDHLRGSAPIWLALFNDYWLTEADTYRLALSRMALEHPFQKILLVNGDKSVDPLFEQ